jgi:2-polyprenyl-3-methyl-5-hydroxy-6-metoxy-1,4-benzoquinol methylase
MTANSNITDTNNRPESYFDSIRDDMLRYVPPASRKTLEFGCGRGGFSSLVKQRLAAQTWAVEIDKTSAAAAAAKLDKVICADALDALGQLPENYFDCIIFFDVLEHMINPYSLLDGVRTKLAAGGVVVASIPNIRYYRAFVEYVFGADWRYRQQGVMDKTHLRFFTKKSILRMFDELGFEILAIEGIHPTSSRTYKVLNLLLLGSIRDVRYKHFAVVARPASA